MKLLNQQEQKNVLSFISQAIEIAKLSPCFRSKCGSIIVKNNEIIGQGYNSPPLDEKLDHCLKDDLPKGFKSDKTCCIHAEQRAIMNELQS